ncbi:MAG: S46 family peptidase [Capnocytophaga sp.]|nr:S46 family peptidase [Capnocytophaga sp.]
MKRIIVAFVAIMSFIPSALRADEGMWFLMFIERLNQRDMQKLGLQLTAEEIYSINNNSLKDAIVQFNGGCTASIISNQGLVLTNHHCGYGQIAELSSPESNHLRDGFWAKTKAEELSPKSLYVRFFVRMDNVTERILSKVNDKMTEKEREAAINRETAEIQKENSEGGKYTVSVRPFFQGNEYYYFVYQDFNDVRLVGTPPESIGKFGGDTDNWEWPRHTGDFSIFRVYTDQNGNPAPYSAENIPMNPKKYLNVNIKGVYENDFAMILGYPGRTNRWQTSAWVDQHVKYAYPAWVEGSRVGMDAMEKYMNEDDAIRLMYASKYAQVANYWKNRQGMIDALKAHKTADIKRVTEAKFQKWANKKAQRAEYGTALADIYNYFDLTNEKSKHDNYLFAMLRTTNYAGISRSLGRNLSNYANAEPQFRSQLRGETEAAVDRFFDNMYIPIEKEALKKQLALYSSKSVYPIAPYIKEIAEQNNGNFDQYVENLVANSIYASKESVAGFLDNPDAEALQNDGLTKLSESIITQYLQSSPAIDEASEKYTKAYRKFVKGLRASKLSTILYPDANSTLRLTYGTVRALPANPRNDAKTNDYTTFEGMLAKYKKDDHEFDLPTEMFVLHDARDYGRYADKDGSLHINFLTDNDITGGNSGSPVMNGNGEIIGLAFDGNIEAMASDVIFDSELQRTINVDIRYVLWVIDKFSNAKHIVDEMTVIE